MGKRANEDIRAAAREARVKLWEVAEALGMSGPQLSVLLRHELATKIKGKIRTAIERIQKQHQHDEQD